MAIGGPRRYRLLGGLLAWRIPVVVVVLSAAALWTREWAIATGVAVLGAMIWQLDGAAIVEVSSQGLACGYALPGGVVAGVRVVRWRLVDAVETRWLRPNDFTALETIVRARDGSVRFTTSMGLRAHRRVLREVERRAPHARHLGLTDEVLRAPLRRHRRAPVLGIVYVVLAATGLLALYL